MYAVPRDLKRPLRPLLDFINALELQNACSYLMAFASCYFSGFYEWLPQAFRYTMYTQHSWIY